MEARTLEEREGSPFSVERRTLDHEGVSLRSRTEGFDEILQRRDCPMITHALQASVAPNNERSFYLALRVCVGVRLLDW